jgi:hypothetical protein
MSEYLSALDRRLPDDRGLDAYVSTALLGGFFRQLR